MDCLIDCPFSSISTQFGMGSVFDRKQKVNDSNVSDSDQNAAKEYEEEFRRKMYQLKQWGMTINENELKRIVEYQMKDVPKGPPKRYTADFTVSFTRKRPDIARSLFMLHSKKDGDAQSKKKKNHSMFEVDVPFTVAVMGRSRALFEFVMKSKDILTEFRAKKHVFSMLSLLDFACK